MHIKPINLSQQQVLLISVSLAPRAPILLHEACSIRVLASHINLHSFESGHCSWHDFLYMVNLSP